MSYQSTLSITLKSDWKIGSGTGRPGDVDQLIRRDSDQAPFLPAKTITGVLRDGCERATHALDEGNLDLAPFSVRGCIGGQNLKKRA